jgi:predicted nucleic acid-binding protein
MKYLLDTNIVSYFSDPGSPFHSATIKRFSALDEEDRVFISVLTLYETEYGIVYAAEEKKSRMAEVKEMMRQFLFCPSGIGYRRGDFRTYQGWLLQNGGYRSESRRSSRRRFYPRQLCDC